MVPLYHELLYFLVSFAELKTFPLKGLPADTGVQYEHENTAPWDMSTSALFLRQLPCGNSNCSPKAMPSTPLSTTC